MNSKRDQNRLGIESVCLVLLLALWVALFVGVRDTQRWRAWFAAGPTLVDLDAGVRGPVSRRAGRWHIEGTAGRVVSWRLMPLAVDPDVDHLLIVRAASGPGFAIGIGPTGEASSGRRKRIAPRGREESSVILLPAQSTSGRLRLRFYLHSAFALDITGLEMRALSPLQRLVPTWVGLAGPLLLLGFALRHWSRLLAYFAAGPGHDRSIDRLAVATLILPLFVIFQQAPVNQTMDAKFLTAVSHSLLTRGSLALPPNLVPTVRESPPYHFVTHDGRTYHFFASAPAILNAPIVYAFERAGVSSVAPDGRFFRQREVRIFRVAAALVAALLCGVLFLLARIWLRPGAALALTLVFAFGTQIFSTISRPYWSHSWASLLLAAGLYPLLAPHWAERRWAYAASATLLSWSFFCRPTMAVAVLGATGFVFVTRRRFVQPLVGTGIAWLTIFMVHSRWTRGVWLPGYFLSAHVSSGRLLSEAVRSDYLEAMLGTLISPGRGQLIYVPMTLGILFVVGRYWRDLPSRPLATTALVVLVAHWQLVSNFGTWWGGLCFGPRLFSDVVVWLFLLAALGAAALGRASERPRPVTRQLLKALVLLLVLASIFINTRGAIAPATIRWKASPRTNTEEPAPKSSLFIHRKLWDWRHPQFLAGL